MTAKPVVSRELAHRDVDDAIAHYLLEGAEQAALGFDVWRVLHGQRDIPAWMQESDPAGGA